MPKIVVSLRSSFFKGSRCLQKKRQKPAKENNRFPWVSLYILSTEYLNFRHFRQFAILGISLNSLIYALKSIGQKIHNDIF